MEGSPGSPWRKLFAGACIALISVVLVELAASAAVKLELLDTPKPLRAGTGFWKGHHPTFGVWHEPDAELTHEMRCFEETYRTNSAGARDVERSRRASAPRVIVLGDSFLEGWGVAREERFSERLESATGIEHLNFAMSHFGPYQQLIVYRELARQWDHEAVIASVAPHNDFLDISLERSDAVANYAFRYRPYLVETEDGFVHVDHREPAPRRWLRQRSYAFNAILHASRLVWPRSSRLPSDPNIPEPRFPSNFYDFHEGEYRALREILTRLARETRPRRLVVLLVPMQNDVLRYRADGGDPLSKRLAGLARQEGFLLVNLLPRMSAERPGQSGLFHSCDFHWSARGHERAAEIALDRLRESLYEPLESRADDTERRAG